MKPHPKHPEVGLIGGAGPLAGAFMFQKIIHIFQQKYGYQEDDEFPYIMLLSYPFSDMLVVENGADLARIQLDICFSTLSEQKVKIAAIACNTLHAFIEETYGITFVHMIEELAKAVKSSTVVGSLVLGSMTSRNYDLHGQYFTCCYPDDELQLEAYHLMNKVLAGKADQTDTEKLMHDINLKLSFCQKEKKGEIGLVLGCTEFSVLNDQFPFYDHGLSRKFPLFDGNQLVAEKICELVTQKSAEG